MPSSLANPCSTHPRIRALTGTLRAATFSIAANVPAGSRTAESARRGRVAGASYYATRVPGHGSHYRTSPSLTPWFGRLVACELHRMWQAIGRPDPFWVVEVGGGQGDLAADAMAAADAMGVPLRWLRRTDSYPLSVLPEVAIPALLAVSTRSSSGVTVLREHIVTS